MSLGLVGTVGANLRVRQTVRPVSELGKLVNFGTLEDTNPILHPDGTRTCLSQKHCRRVW